MHSGQEVGGLAGSQLFLVEALLAGALLVGALLVGALLVGALLVGALLVGGPVGGGPFGPWWGLMATSASSGGPFTGLGGGGPFGGPWGCILGDSLPESNNSSVSFGSANGMPKTACV